MFTISFFLRKTSKTPGAPYTLYARIHPGDIPVTTHEKLKPDTDKKKGEWDADNEKVRASHPAYMVINARIEKLRLALSIYLREQEYAGEQISSEKMYSIINPARALKRQQRRATGPKEETSIRGVYDAWKKDFLADRNLGNQSEKQKGAKYVNGFSALVDKLLKFNPALKFADLQKESVIWDFRKWLLTDTKNQDSTIGWHMKGVRNWLRYKKLDTSHVKSPKLLKSTKYSLFWPEVIQLRDYPYESELQRQAAHTFVIDCQICLRYSDLNMPAMKRLIDIKSTIHGAVKVVDFNQGKTGDAAYIPFPPVSAALMGQYGWRLPWDFGDDREGNESSNFNKALKAAAKHAGLKREIRCTTVHNGHVVETWEPLHKLISAHDARHTGNTLVVETTGDQALGDALLGHNDSGPYSHANPMLLVNKLLDAWKQIENAVKP